MNFQIKTLIKNSPPEIFKLFTLDLFIALKPPLTSLKVTRFDGCKKGDEVHLIVNGQKWISHITENIFNEKEMTFYDEGFVIPFPLKYWFHKHKIIKEDSEHCYVIDDITYQTSFYLLDLLLLPIFLTMFSFRKPIYRKKLNKMIK